MTPGGQFNEYYNQQQRYTQDVTSLQNIANRQFNESKYYKMYKKHLSEWDKRLLETRQKQCDIRRKMWSMFK